MANEVEKVLSIKVDYAEAVEKIADYKSKIDEIKEAERRYREGVVKGTMKQEEYNKFITAAKVKTNEYRTAIRVLEKQLTSQVKTQKANADIMKEVNGLLGVKAKSIAEAEAANKALREAVRNLSDEEEGAYALRRKLNDQIEENTRYIQRNSDEYIKQKMNIGNYTESIVMAYTQIKSGGDAMQTVGIVAKGFADMIGKDMVRAFKDMFHQGTRFMGMIKFLKTALISTGIGAFIVLLGSLVAAFQRTQRGMEIFQRVTAMIGAAIDVVLDRVAMLGSAIVHVFKGEWQQAADAARGAFTGIGEEIVQEVKAADALKKSLIQIEKEEKVLAVTRSRNRATIENLKKIAEDTTKSEKERLAAAQQAYAIEMKDMNAQVNLQKRRIANMLGYENVTKEVNDVIEKLNSGVATADEVISQLGLSSSTMSDFEQFADEVIKLNELQENSLTRQIEQKNKINSIQESINKKADEGVATIEVEVKAESGLDDEQFKKEYERQQKLAQARLEAIESNSEEELALKRKINEMAMNEELRQYAEDEEMKIAIKEQYRAKDEALVKAYNDRLIEEDKRRTQEQIEIEQAKSEAMKDVTANLIGLLEEVGESNKAAAIAAKVIALAQIAINTGEAIAKMVSAEAGKGIAGIVTMATGIAAILANIATAIKTVKSAKFATGGDVKGAGTGTSDSIPAMLSNGESVLTAKATSMFAPILSAFNQAGGGVPIQGQQTGNQAMGEDMLARAFAKGLEGLPNPVVSVEEITTVSNRVKAIENLNRI